jgi:conjugal transfer pilus assembly protein TraB
MSGPDGQGDLGGAPLPSLDLSGNERRDQGEAAGPALLDIKRQWARLSSGQRLRAKQIGVAASVALVGYVLYTASTSETDAPKPPQVSNLNMGAGLRGDSLEIKLRGDLQKILDGQTLLGDRVTAIEEGGAPTPDGSAGAERPVGEEGGLPPALPGHVPAYPPSPANTQASDDVPPPPPSAPPAPPAPPTERQLGAIGAAVNTTAPEGGAAGGARSKKANRTIYLPPGFMKARLLTGIDALASRDATSNPEPIMARVQAPAVLPNDVKANLAGCFVIGNATGSLAKERVEVQLVSISCIDFEEHAVVDQPIKGFFVDTDGKKGLSGKVVTRVGATLARSFIAGTIAGIAQTVEGSFGSVATSPLGSVRSLDAGEAAKTGIAGGLGRSSDKITEFYLDLARQAGPVVEVGAAKDVVVVIQEGLALEIKPSVGSKF